MLKERDERGGYIVPLSKPALPSPPAEPQAPLDRLKQLRRDVGTVRLVLARTQITRGSDDEAQDRMLERWESQIDAIEAALSPPSGPVGATPMARLQGSLRGEESDTEFDQAVQALREGASAVSAPHEELRPEDYPVIIEAVNVCLGFDVTTREQQDRITKWASALLPCQEGQPSLLALKSAYVEGFNAARDTDGQSGYEAWLHSAAKHDAASASQEGGQDDEERR